MSLGEYRQARGLSIAQVAERVGISRHAADLLDRSDLAWRSLTFDQLTSLAASYGIHLDDLIDRLTVHRPLLPSDDATKLEAALSYAGELRRDDIATIFGWTLERTEAAFSALVDALRGRGQALARPSPESYRLITRPDILGYDQPSRLIEACGTNQAGPTVAEANVIRMLADMPRQRGCRELFCDPDEQAAVNRLLAAGTLAEWDDTLALAADVAFSIYERAEPSAFLSAMTQAVSNA